MKNIQKIRQAGVDLAQNVIQIYAADQEGRKVMSRRFSRAKALEVLEQMSPSMIGIEACSGAHSWGRILTGMGREVKMMPAQHVRPHVKTRKTEAADAEAALEAMHRSTVRLVEIKTEQQTVLLAHRVRDPLIKQRTQTINAMRWRCAEFGMAAPKGGWNAGQLAELIRDRADLRIPHDACAMLGLLSDQLEALKGKIARADEQIQAYFRADEACQRLEKVPGIGALAATCLAAAIGDGRQL